MMRIQNASDVKIKRPSKAKAYSRHEFTAVQDGKPMKPEKVVAFLETEYGMLSLRQEIFCWRYALHGSGMKACREAYNHSTENSQNVASYRLRKSEKIVRRINELIQMHKDGVVDLHQGPWEHYNISGIGEMDRPYPKKLTIQQMANV